MPRNISIVDPVIVTRMAMAMSSSTSVRPDRRQETGDRRHVAGRLSLVTCRLSLMSLGGTAEVGDQLQGALAAFLRPLHRDGHALEAGGIHEGFHPPAIHTSE